MSGQTIGHYLQHLWQKGFFSQERTFAQVVKKLGALGSNPQPPALSKALSRAQFITTRGKRGQYRYVQKNAPTPLKAQIDILPDDLSKMLERDFKTELSDLRLNHGQSGTCTAFLLRKILEKLIFLVFAKNGQQAKLYDLSGHLIGLQAMLSLATSSTVSGRPFLMQKTANAIQGAKFLGDAAAHDPLANVSMKTIQHEMPYIVTAYQELASNL